MDTFKMYIITANMEEVGISRTFTEAQDLATQYRKMLGEIAVIRVFETTRKETVELRKREKKLKAKLNANLST